MTRRPPGSYEELRFRATVNSDRALSKGFAGLLDAPRSGAPRKLSAHLPAIDEWAQTAPLSTGEVHKRLVEEFDVSVHRNTVRNELKRLGFVWKRT